MRSFRPTLTLALTLVLSALAVMPSSAQRSHGRRRITTTNNPPANASAAVCRTRARDYAYEKHADIGQERGFYDKCMGGR